MTPTIAVLIVFLISGCVTQTPPVPLLNGTTLTGAPVCFGDPATIPSFFERFYATRDLTTGEGKIDYLIERVAYSNLIFIRNGVGFGSRSSAQFLRWKMDRLRKRHGIKIETAEAFVSEVATGSRMSGDLYAVVVPGGGRHKLKSLLENELAVLNACLKETVAREAGEVTATERTMEDASEELHPAAREG